MSYNPFSLTEPCGTCPFRTDRPFHGLAVETVEAIAEHLSNGGDHLCHKTTPFDEDGQAIRGSTRARACMGGRAVQANSGIESTSERILMVHHGIVPRDIPEDAPVYDSIDEWVADMRTRARP